MPTIRQGKRAGYFSCSRSMPQDETLSAETVGMLSYLLSKPDDWVVQFEDIERRFKWGRDKRRKVFAEAEASGYFERIISRAGKQQFTYDLVFHEAPLPPEKRTSISRRNKAYVVSPCPGKPSTVEPSTVEPSTVEPSTAMYIELHNTELHKTERHKSESDITKGKEAKKPQPAHKPKLSALAQMLLKVCRLPESLSEKQFTDFQEVEQLHIEAGHDVESLHARFGADGFWYRFFKNGRNVSAPTLWQTWEQYDRIGEVATTNDSKARDARILKRMAEIRAERTGASV